MNHKTNISSFARVKEFMVSLRRKYGIKNRYSMHDCAHKAGLTVEYLGKLPKSVEGFLDHHDEPRFIAVNSDLPMHDQAFFIARQLAARAHERRYISVALNRPWKWNMLDAAPLGLKEKIRQLDIEYRAHCLMVHFATADEYRAFIRADPKRFWSHVFTDNIVAYHLSTLQVKLWLTMCYRTIVIVAFSAA